MKTRHSHEASMTDWYGTNLKSYSQPPVMRIIKRDAHYSVIHKTIKPAMDSAMELIKLHLKQIRLT